MKNITFHLFGTTEKYFFMSKKNYNFCFSPFFALFSAVFQRKTKTYPRQICFLLFFLLSQPNKYWWKLFISFIFSSFNQKILMKLFFSSKPNTRKCLKKYQNFPYKNYLLSFYVDPTYPNQTIPKKERSLSTYPLVLASSM